jgi:hypothetical protein
MRCFMREGRIITFGIAEGLEGRHLHEVLRDIIISHRAAMPDSRPGTSEKGLGSINAFDGVNSWLGLGAIMIGQVIDLLDVENRIALLGLNRFAVVTRGTVRCHHLIFLHSR